MFSWRYRLLKSFWN